MGKYRFIIFIFYFAFLLPAHSEIASWKSYRVVKGDSLFQVARKFNTGINDLYQLNPQKKKNPSLYAGEILKVPVAIRANIPIVEKDKSHFRFPLERRISIIQKFSNLSYAPHKGISFQKTTSPLGVVASRGGKVAAIDYMDGYGNYIILQHYGGYYSVYGNIGKILVNEGQVIESGTKIGMTDKEQGLYFQLSLQDKPVDPLPYIL